MKVITGILLLSLLSLLSVNGAHSADREVIKSIKSFNSLNSYGKKCYSENAEDLGGPLTLSEEDKKLALMKRTIDLDKERFSIKGQTFKDYCKNKDKLNPVQKQTLKLLVDAAMDANGIQDKYPTCEETESMLTKVTSLSFVNFEPAKELLASVVSIKKVSLYDIATYGRDSEGSGFSNSTLDEGELVTFKQINARSPIVKYLLEKATGKAIEKVGADTIQGKTLKGTSFIVMGLLNQKWEYKITPNLSANLGICQNAITDRPDCIKVGISKKFR